MNDLLLANAKQKKNKELQLVEQAKQEKDEYERIVKKQLYDMEVEKKIEAEKKRKRYEHNNDLLKMIKLREEKNKVYDREILEEGKKNRQRKDDWLERIEKIKKQKIQYLKDLGVEPKFIVDLEKYKIQ